MKKQLIGSIQDGIVRKSPNSNFSNLTFNVDLAQQKGLVSIAADGPVTAIEINFKYRTTFESMLGDGFLFASKNRKLMIVSINNKSISGNVFKYFGNFKIRNMKVVAPDSKYVENITISRLVDKWDSLDSNWDSLGYTYQSLNYDGTNKQSSTSKSDNSMFSNIQNSYSVIRNYNKALYLKGKEYKEPFNIYHDTAIALTGTKPSKRMQVLSYNMPTIIKQEGIADLPKANIKTTDNSPPTLYSEAVTQSLSEGKKILRDLGLSSNVESYGAADRGDIISLQNKNTGQGDGIGTQHGPPGSIKGG